LRHRVALFGPLRSVDWATCWQAGFNKADILT